MLNTIDEYGAIKIVQDTRERRPAPRMIRGHRQTTGVNRSRPARRSPDHADIRAELARSRAPLASVRVRVSVTVPLRVHVCARACIRVVFTGYYLFREELYSMIEHEVTCTGAPRLTMILRD